MSRKLTAQIWLVKKVYEITDWRQLNGLIPSDVKSPDDAYGCIDCCLVVQRGVPVDPDQESCLLVNPFRIPGDSCVLTPVIWRDRIWHLASDWERHWWISQGITTSGPGSSPRPCIGFTWETIPIPEHPENEQWMMFGMYRPEKDRLGRSKYPELPVEWEQLDGKRKQKKEGTPTFDVELVV